MQLRRFVTRGRINVYRRFSVPCVLSLFPAGTWARPVRGTRPCVLRQQTSSGLEPGDPAALSAQRVAGRAQCCSGSTWRGGVRGGGGASRLTRTLQGSGNLPAAAAGAEVKAASHATRSCPQSGDALPELPFLNLSPPLLCCGQKRGHLFRQDRLPSQQSSQPTPGAEGQPTKVPGTCCGA